MKPYILLFYLFSLTTASWLQAQTQDVTASHWQMTRNGQYIDVVMDLQLGKLEVAPNQALLITPRFWSATDSVEMKSVGIYSRKRYYQYQRLHGQDMLSGRDETSYRSSQVPATHAFQDLVSYETWMEGAQLNLLCQEYGCCNTILREWQVNLGTFFTPVFHPVYVYQQPDVEKVKYRQLSGSAFITFPVNRTEIRPDFHQNQAELQKITATIDSVKNDADIRLNSVSIRGYASPEGSFANNRRLAEGRTASVKQYVEGLYQFDDNFIQISSEAENWEGLHQYVEASQLPQRDELLELIDSNLEPDAKERKLRARWPETYRQLLKDCYPTLRRTDYCVNYTIRTFTDVAEIKAVMQKEPQKLSLSEFQLVAQELEVGSLEYNEVFETAVRMYPDDPVANLNAANSAMRRKDYPNAARYLKRAGNTPKALYAQGILAALQEEYDTARTYLVQAQKAGIAEATDALEQIQKLTQK